MNRTAVRRLVEKYSTRGPRYTSYPSADRFGSLSEATARSHIESAAARVRDDWSLYVHIPFCTRRCDFCACSVVASPHHDRVAPPYLERVLAELDTLDPLLGDRRGVAQLHLGGGTPTYLAPALLERLYSGLRSHFWLTDATESSVELDPRVTTKQHLDVMVEQGVNRVSIGVQDLDPSVQRLIGRDQSADETGGLVESVVARGIASVNVDLVYGLPGQTLESLQRTVAAVAALPVGRVALYGYAHVPWIRGNQSRIDESRLPGPQARLEMFLAAREGFEGAGMRAIGLDHFARRGDGLAIAELEGRLQRNFMGYTVRAGTDLLGFGTTAISDVGGAMLQNATKLIRYQRDVDAGRLPVERGVVRTFDDEVRRRVIADLMCRHRVDKSEIEARFDLADFDGYFAAALPQLREFVDDGLLREASGSLVLTPIGRLFVRNVAMVFDAYLAPRPNVVRHSATI